MSTGRKAILNKRLADALVKCNKAIYVDSYQKKVISSEDYNVKENNLEKLREEYKKIKGKKAFHGWTVDQIKEKLLEK